MAVSRGCWRGEIPRNRNERLHNYSADRLHQEWVISNEGSGWRVSEQKAIYWRQHPAILVFGTRWL